MRTLLLLRHGSAESTSSGQGDVGRCLTDRGKQEAAAAGAWLAERQLQPGRVLCSAAVRARQTLDGVRQGGLATLAADVRDDLYLANAGELLDALAELPDGLDSVLVIAHNPGLSDLAQRLAHLGDQALRQQASRGLMPAGLVELACDKPWTHWMLARAEVRGFFAP